MIEISDQRKFWNKWNEIREFELGDVSLDQADQIEQWLNGRTGLDILDVGTGTGWLCERLLRYGRVTGTDLADEVIERARQRVPSAKFISGDFLSIEFDRQYDVITTLEVLSHVADQSAFVAKIASLLKPSGEVFLATQNRFVLERSDIPPPGEGQLRKWLNRAELESLLSPHLRIIGLVTLTPEGHRGILRLVNSRKINWPIEKIIGAARTKQMKERWGLGWTILVRATPK